MTQCHSGDLLGLFSLSIPTVSAGSRGLDLAMDLSWCLPRQPLPAQVQQCGCDLGDWGPRLPADPGSTLLWAPAG